MRATSLMQQMRRVRDERGGLVADKVILIGLPALLVIAAVCHFVFGVGWLTIAAVWGILTAAAVLLVLGVLAYDRWQQAQPRHRDERGAVTAYVVLFTVALIAVAGLVIDGGYALGARREAMNQAEQAARAGADALDQGALRSGHTYVDPNRAVGAAQSYLAQVGAHGSVSVNGGRVTVTVSKKQKTTLLAAVGVGSMPVKATATALSINEDDQP